jgi:hypothetical protein
VCRRFYGLVGRLHYSRLIDALNLRDHEMVLECFHPSVKISTPTLHCDYLGTDGLSEAGSGDVHLDTLNGLYSRFRPLLTDDQERPRARHPTKSVREGSELPLFTMPSHDIHLDAEEPFSQLCTIASLIKIGPRRGLFLSIANVTDGVIRVWRDWLRKHAVASSDLRHESIPILEDESILWTDSSNKHVGLRFEVTEKDISDGPVLLGPQDEPPVSYTLEFKGMYSKDAVALD